MYNEKNDRDLNRDPITGEPGAHPIGTGLGAAGGASAGAAAGLAIGAAAGPVGAAAGAVIGAAAGGIAGGFAGKGVAEAVNPTEVDTYWSSNYSNRPYVESGTGYDTYKPAYLHGYDARVRHEGRSFDDAESDIKAGWEKTKSNASLTWDKAKFAVRDGFDYTDRTYRERTGAGNVSAKSTVSA